MSMWCGYGMWLTYRTGFWLHRNKTVTMIMWDRIGSRNQNPFFFSTNYVVEKGQTYGGKGLQNERSKWSRWHTKYDSRVRRANHKSEAIVSRPLMPFVYLMALFPLS